MTCAWESTRKILPHQCETNCEVKCSRCFFLHAGHWMLCLARAGEVLSHRAVTSPGSLGCRLSPHCLTSGYCPLSYCGCSTDSCVTCWIEAVIQFAQSLTSKFCLWVLSYFGQLYTNFLDILLAQCLDVSKSHPSIYSNIPARCGCFHPNTLIAGPGTSLRVWGQPGIHIEFQDGQGCTDPVWQQ